MNDFYDEKKKEPIHLKPNPLYTGETVKHLKHLKPNPLYKVNLPTESKSPGPGPLMKTPQSSGGGNRPDPRRVKGLLVVVLAAILALVLAFCGKNDKSAPTAPSAPSATTAPVEAPVAPPAQREEEETFYTASPVSLASLEKNLHKYDVISLISSSSYKKTDYEGFIHQNYTDILCDNPSKGNCFGYAIAGRYSTLSGSLYGYDETEPVCWLEIYGDGQLLCTTDKVSVENPSTSFEVDVSGVKQLKIVPLCDSYDAFSDSGWLMAEDLVLTP